MEELMGWPARDYVLLTAKDSGNNEIFSYYLMDIGSVEGNCITFAPVAPFPTLFYYMLYVQFLVMIIIIYTFG